MKKWILPLHRTKRFGTDQKAAVTLEAALIFPLIIILFYFFYMLLLACMIQMSMKSVAYTTVTSIASQIHAVDKVGQLAKNQWNKNAIPSEAQPPSTEQSWINEELTALLPEPIHTIVIEGQKGNWWPATNLANTALGKGLYESLLYQLPESRGLEKDRLSLVYLQLPDIVNYTDATVKVTLQYELPFSIPFIDRPFIIREQASQRAWLPDSKSTNFEVSDEDDMFIQFISLTPNPAPIGRKAMLTFKTKPYATLSIEIMYKSGKSVAKNLTPKTADANGDIAWEWFVGTKTTPGLWQYHVKDTAGGAEVRGFIEVKKSQ